MRQRQQTITRFTTIAISVALIILLAIGTAGSQAHATPWAGAQQMATPTGTTPTSPEKTRLEVEKLGYEVEKAKQDAIKARNENSGGPVGSWLRSSMGTIATALATVLVGLIGLRRYFAEKGTEAEKRADERFQDVVEGLASTEPSKQLGAAVGLSAFLGPHNERFYAQIRDLAVAYLRQAPTSTEPSAGTDRQLPITQTLATVLARAFPMERNRQPRDYWKTIRGRVTQDVSSVRIVGVRLHGADFRWSWMRETDFTGVGMPPAAHRRGCKSGYAAPGVGGGHRGRQ